VSVGARSLFRSRVFVVALCASVFLLSLHTRVCLFHTYKLCIKAFNNDYDRLKVKAAANRSTHSIVSAKSATHHIAFFSLRALPDVEPYAASSKEDVAARLICFVGLRQAIRPPPLA
jgi:hypothetical protein